MRTVCVVACLALGCVACGIGRESVAPAPDPGNVVSLPLVGCSVSFGAHAPHVAPAPLSFGDGDLLDRATFVASYSEEGRAPLGWGVAILFAPRLPGEREEDRLVRVRDLGLPMDGGRNATTQALSSRRYADMPRSLLATQPNAHSFTARYPGGSRRSVWRRTELVGDFAVFLDATHSGATHNETKSFIESLACPERQASTPDVSPLQLHEVPLSVDAVPGMREDPVQPPPQDIAPSGLPPAIRVSAATREYRGVQGRVSLRVRERTVDPGPNARANRRYLQNALADEYGTHAEFRPVHWRTNGTASATYEPLAERAADGTSVLHYALAFGAGAAWVQLDIVVPASPSWSELLLVHRLLAQKNLFDADIERFGTPWQATGETNGTDEFDDFRSCDASGYPRPGVAERTFDVDVRRCFDGSPSHSAEYLLEINNAGHVTRVLRGDTKVRNDNVDSCVAEGMLAVSTSVRNACDALVICNAERCEYVNEFDEEQHPRPPRADDAPSTNRD